MSEDKVCLFMTACGRPDLLEICLKSFVKYNTYPIEQVIICEDCGIKGIDDFVYDILPYPNIKIIYNEKRLYQMKSIENGLQHITCPFVFHLEEDWEFYDSGFIEKSIEILKKNNMVTSVWLHNFYDIHARYNFSFSKVENNDYYIVIGNPPDRTGNGYFSWQPGLRRVEIEKYGAPYPDKFDEGSLNNIFRDMGMYAAMTDKIDGYTKCIDWNRHVKTNIDPPDLLSNPMNISLEYFSQCGEDKILYENYIKNMNIVNPVYLEMGALDGVLYSNTLFFEKYLGWTGILVEPHYETFQKLQVNRPNNKLYNNLVSNIEDDLNYLHYNAVKWVAVAGVMETMTHINTFYDNPNNPINDNYNISKVKPVSLSYIINSSGFDKIDLFSLDVEGHEYNVLLSYDWKIPIKMILIEDNQDSDKIHEFLIGKNYNFVEKVAHNRLYILI